MSGKKGRAKTAARRGGKFRLPLVALCYGIALVLWLGSAVARLSADSVARAGGELQQQVLSPKDFELENLERMPSGVYRSLSDDPKMILDVSDIQLRSLRFGAGYSSLPYEMCLYYTTRPDEPFSQNKRVWPEQQEDGSYLFTLPRADIERIRLDPASAEVEITFGLFVLNEPVAAKSYFAPGWAGLVLLLTLPALVAAALRWLFDMLRHYRDYATAKRWLRRKKMQLQDKKEEPV